MERFADLALDIVLSPTLWLSVLFGLIYAVLFTLWRGGGWRQALRDIVAGVFGFGAGQLLATLLPLPSPRVGDAHLLWGSVFAVLFFCSGAGCGSGGRRRRRVRPALPPCRRFVFELPLRIDKVCARVTQAEVGNGFDHCGARSRHYYVGA